MKNKYFGSEFYSSTLNTILLFVLIILMIIALRFMYQNKIQMDKTEQQINDIIKIKNTSQVKLINWKLIPEQNNNVFYNDMWQFEKNSKDSYSFTLPSGNYLNWANTGSGCTNNQTDRDNTNFKYGVSVSGCIKGWTVWLGVKDINSKNTEEDINSLGDFITKNK